MIKLLSSLLVLLLFFNFFSAGVLAADMIASPYPYNQNTFGTSQFYNVVFDGEGQAVVVAKINVQNLEKDIINDLVLEIPGNNVRIISAFQEYYEKEQKCSYYNYNCVVYAKDTQCTQYDKDGDCVRYEKVCVKQDQQCASWYNQTIYPAKYYSLERTEEQLSSSKRAKFKLDVGIKEQESATLILYYKADGLASEAFDIFNFDFQTIKMDFDIHQVKVSVDVNSDLYFEGGEAKVNYQQNFAVFDKAELTSAKGFQSQELSDFSRSIEYSYGYVKTAQGLDPWESFSVKGRYATTWFALNKWKVLFGVLVVLAVISGLVFGIKKFLRFKKSSLLLNVGFSSFASSILVTIVWFGGIKLLQSFSASFYSRNSEMFILLLGLMWIMLLLVILFSPSIYFGVKQGVIPAIICLVATIMMLLIINVALAMLFGTLNSGRIF